MLFSFYRSNGICLFVLYQVWRIGRSLQVAFFGGDVFFDFRLPASFQQLRTACQCIVFDVDQFFLQPVNFYQLLLSGVSVVDIEDDKHHDEHNQLALAAEEVSSQNVASDDVLPCSASSYLFVLLFFCMFVVAHNCSFLFVIGIIGLFCNSQLGAS